MNLRPPGYEPDELPDCSIPREYEHLDGSKRSAAGVLRAIHTGHLMRASCFLAKLEFSEPAMSTGNGASNGWRWIRTTEAICSRFTVCPLWPLGNPSLYFQKQIISALLQLSVCFAASQLIRRSHFEVSSPPCLNLLSASQPAD